MNWCQLWSCGAAVQEVKTGTDYRERLTTRVLEASIESHNRREDEKLMCQTTHTETIETGGGDRIVEIITDVTGIP
jgi:hypothetical protein